MRAKITISGPKGFLAETEKPMRIVADVKETLLKWLDTLPDEVDGQRLIDWNKISIEIAK